MTNKFHVIPKFLLKKMNIDEEKELFYLDILENSKRTPIFFDARDLEKIPSLSKEDRDSFFELANIIEEVWTNSNIESNFSKFATNLRKKSKSEKKCRIIEISNEEKDIIDALWEKTDVFSGKFEEFKNISYNNIIFNIMTSLISTLMHIKSSSEYIIKESEARVSKKLYENILVIINQKNEFDQEAKFGERNPYFNYESESNKLHAIPIEVTQPLFTTPYIKVNPELVDMEYLHLAPYGYTLIQVNKSYSILIFDFLENKTGHSIIRDTINNLGEEEFNSFKKYFYGNAVKKCVRNIVSNDNEFLSIFKNSFIQRETTSIFENVNILNIELEDFNISPSIRYEKFYKPVEALFEEAFIAFSNHEILQHVYGSGFKLRTPLNYVNKVKSLDMMEQLKKLLSYEISIDKFYNNTVKYINWNKYFFKDVLKIDEEKFEEIWLKKI